MSQISSRRSQPCFIGHDPTWRCVAARGQKIMLSQNGENTGQNTMASRRVDRRRPKPSPTISPRPELSPHASGHPCRLLERGGGRFRAGGEVVNKRRRFGPDRVGVFYYHTSQRVEMNVMVPPADENSSPADRVRRNGVAAEAVLALSQNRRSRRPIYFSPLSVDISG